MSSDWLILGVGSMYRTEKQSQTPTLFDSIDENVSKSVVLESNSDEKNISSSAFIQQKIIQASEIPTQTPSEPVVSAYLPQLDTNSKSVRKIIVYYTDNTFQEFESK